MIVTIVCGLMMMAGLFLMLLSGVGFIQDKRFFGTAPKEVRDAVPDSKPERFHGQHALGWTMAIFSVLMLAAAPIIGAINGVHTDMSFWQLFVRFNVMWLMMKAFDVIFFDWVLLCNAGFNMFPHFYPETKPVLGHYLFGYNWKTHLAHVVGGAVGAAALSWICLIF